jgi:hypothetical protein
MIEADTVSSGACRCRAVTFEATGKPEAVCHCHCESCRRSTGAPAVTFVVFERAQFRFTSAEPSYHESSPGIFRGFCSACGTPLSWHAVDAAHAPFIELYVGTFDAPAGFLPTDHIYYEERVPWYDIADRRPRWARSRNAGEPVRSTPVFPEDAQSR